MKRKIILLVALAAVVSIPLWMTEEPSDLLHARNGDTQTVSSVIEQCEKGVLKKLESNFRKTGLSYDSLQIAILGFKKELKLVVYARNDKADSWREFKTYDFTGFSGGPGPKLRQGDRQIPEGIYNVESLNPNSSYHLSLRVNYPNQYDRSKATGERRRNLGGDIMIHGSNVTVGCIPIGDESIEELFVLAAKSYHWGIPIVISPVDFRTGATAPPVTEIDWIDELYTNIRSELKKYN